MGSRDAAAAGRRVREETTMKVDTRPKVGLESQNDLAYLLGEHKQTERDEQIRTAEPRHTSAEDKRREEAARTGLGQRL